VFQTIESSPHGKGDDGEDVSLSQLHLIDLAGSESSKTEITGQRRKEGSSINKSLLTLGTVRKFFFSITFTLLDICVCKLLISIFRLYLN
jgi:hypothetical protein